jgi:hypothetical protein
MPLELEALKIAADELKQARRGAGAAVRVPLASIPRRRRRGGGRGGSAGGARARMSARAARAAAVGPRGAGGPPAAWTPPSRRPSPPAPLSRRCARRSTRRAMRTSSRASRGGWGRRTRSTSERPRGGGGRAEAAGGRRRGRQPAGGQPLTAAGTPQSPPPSPRALVDAAEQAAAARKERLEGELHGSKSNLIKESIRIGHNDLGDFYYNRGNLQVRLWTMEGARRGRRLGLGETSAEERRGRTGVSGCRRLHHPPLWAHTARPFLLPAPPRLQDAFKCYVRTRDYCTTPRHVLAMCLNIIRCAVEMGNFLHVANYVGKAEATPEGMVRGRVAGGQGNGAGRWGAGAGRGRAAAAEACCGEGGLGRRLGGPERRRRGGTPGAPGIPSPAAAPPPRAVRRVHGGQAQGGVGAGAARPAQVPPGGARVRGGVARAGLHLQRGGRRAPRPRASRGMRSKHYQLVGGDRPERPRQRRGPTSSHQLPPPPPGRPPPPQVLSPADVALYGGLCALATFDRSELQSKVIGSVGFREFLELHPQVGAGGGRRG